VQPTDAFVLHQIRISVRSLPIKFVELNLEGTLRYNKPILGGKRKGHSLSLTTSQNEGLRRCDSIRALFIDSSTLVYTYFKCKRFAGAAELLEKGINNITRTKDGGNTAGTLGNAHQRDRTSGSKRIPLIQGTSITDLHTLSGCKYAGFLINGTAFTISHINKAFLQRPGLGLSSGIRINENIRHSSPQRI